MFSTIKTQAVKANTAVRNAAIFAVCSVPFLALAGQADPFDAAVADVQAKALGYAAKLVALAAATVAVFVAIKYVKKIRGAA